MTKIHENDTENRETLGVLLKESRETPKNDRHEQEHENNVHNRESTPDTCGLSELACSIERNTTHKWDGVPNDNAGNVEEQVCQGNLKRIDIVRNKRSHESRHGSTNVCSKRQRKHLLELQHTHTDEGGQGRCRDRRGLDQDGETSTNKNRQVSVDVGGLVENTGRHTEQELLQNGNKANKTGDQDDESNEEANASRNLIIVLRSTGLEECRAFIRGFIAANKTDFASILGRIGRILTRR